MLRNSTSHTPSPTSVQGFGGILIWVQKKIFLHLGWHEENISVLHSSANASKIGLSRDPIILALLSLKLLGTQRLPPSPGAGFIAATPLAVFVSPALDCSLLIRMFR